MTSTETVTFATADGIELRGRLRMPGDAVTGVAVLCHPHPAFGGNMDVWVLPAISERLASDGWACLRFDFRPDTAASMVDAHDPQRRDLAAAVRLARQRAGHPPRLALVGWSFGALVALLYGLDDPDVTDWVGIGPPTTAATGLPLAEIPVERAAHWSARRTVIVGEHDQFFPPRHAHRVSPHRVTLVKGTDHFLFGHDHEIAGAVAEALTG